MVSLRSEVEGMGFRPWNVGNFLQVERFFPGGPPFG